MKIVFSTFLLSMLFCHSVSGQSSELNKFYSYYTVSNADKNICDSVYNLIERRRAAFSKRFREYKEEKGSAAGFSYDWSADEKNILSSFKKNRPVYLRHLLYYSYFDLGYGIYGLHLKPSVCRQALEEIPPSSAVWAMEPGLLDAVIKAAGGEDKYISFITRLSAENKDANLKEYVTRNLSPDRPLKINKILPGLPFRSFSDTLTLLSTKDFTGKYLLIDIWATWCRPCIDEFPGLLNAYKNKNSNLEFLSISIDNDAMTAIKFIETRFPLPWQKGAAVTRKDILDTLMITGIPCTILVSPEGKILAYGYDLRGERLAKTLKNEIR